MITGKVFEAEADELRFRSDHGHACCAVLPSRTCRDPWSARSYYRSVSVPKMEAPDGFTMSVAIKKCGDIGWTTSPWVPLLGNRSVNEAGLAANAGYVSVLGEGPCGFGWFRCV